MVAKANKQTTINKFGKGVSKKNDVFNYCKQKGHWVNKCSKWISDGKPGENQRATKSGQTNLAPIKVALVTICGKACAVETDSLDWRIDNEATKHVINCSNIFIDFKEFDSPYRIQAAGKESLEVIGKGTI